MKKNKMMRIASVLLVAVLISTCAISGTFAKYVTKAEGTDSARVAKWGILLDIKGADVFSDKYLAQDEGYIAAVRKDLDDEEADVYSVISYNGDKVVAPGTSSEILESNLVASVKGTPEVATRYTLVATKLSDIFLPAGEYTDYTVLEYTEATADAAASYGYTKTFTTPAYSPIKWNMTISGKGKTIDLAKTLWEEMEDFQTQLTAYGFSENGVSIFDAVKIVKKVAGSATYKTVVENALKRIVSGGHNFQLDVVTDDNGVDTLTLSYDFEPNKAMDFTFTLDWEWAFEKIVDNEADPVVDAADTYLGNMIVAKLDGNNANEQLAADYADFEGSLEIAATVTATATQID